MAWATIRSFSSFTFLGKFTIRDRYFKTSRLLLDDCLLQKSLCELPPAPPLKKDVYEVICHNILAIDSHNNSGRQGLGYWLNGVGLAIVLTGGFAEAGGCAVADVARDTIIRAREEKARIYNRIPFFVCYRRNTFLAKMT